MKGIWKYVLIILFLPIFLGGAYLVSETKSDTESNMEKADKLFDEGKFQEALTEYELLFKETTFI